MAKKRGKKSSRMVLHWILIVCAAFLLYQGVQFFLPKNKPGEQKTTQVSSITQRITPSPQPSKGPIPKWSFQTAGQFLPSGAYPDNYQSIPIDQYVGLLAYAKTMPGKTPGPQGLTNTRPGLRWLHLIDHTYQAEDLDFKPLSEVLGEKDFQRLTGLPQIKGKPIETDTGKIYSTRLFLQDNPQTVMSYLVIDAKGAHWASLVEADGKKIPAVFLEGTTRTTTRKVKTEMRGGKNYLIVDFGQLNPAKIYEGYQWKIDAYRWNGEAFSFDPELSKKLTEEKSKQQI